MEVFFMLKFVSLVILPTLLFAPQGVENTGKAVEKTMIEDYAIVSEKSFDCYENAIPYAKNHDKKSENAEVRTLEELQEWMQNFEKKPLAKSVSGEENNERMERVFDMLDEKFEYMFELKNTLDKREKETAKMWSEYYAIKEVYDRAVAKYMEKWAEDNGVLLAKNHKRANFRMPR
jgi:hypothetical protein